jgi:porphobilinogen synthase
MREIAMDVSEGADAIIIKPGLPYLDVVKEASQNFSLPIFSYQVSGEYAALAFGAKAGALDFMKTLFETVAACKRAGASAVISYAASEIAKKIS